MKKKKELKAKKHKDKQKTKSPKNKSESEEVEVPKEIGIFNDFLVYEKSQKSSDINSYIYNQDLDIFSFKNEPTQKESRFSALFKELMENDKKNEKNEAEDEKKINNEDKNKNQELDEEKKEENNNDQNQLLYSTTFASDKLNENKITEFNYTKTFFPNIGTSENSKISINSSSSGQNGSSTNDTGYTLYTNSFLNNSLNKNSFDSNKANKNKSKNAFYDNNIQEIIFEPTVDIYKILSLEDKRATIMIKNIPNKFNREILLTTIDQHFKGTYDLFILPNDGNRNKNFGYSFINFTSSYYIPYFYFMFNNKKWAGTNSKKICEITYSKVQGRANLLSYYTNKIIFFNNNWNVVTSEQKYIIPNEYKNFFLQSFPNHKIEEFNFYFITKMPK